ncbi:uncharacterized protein BJ212DRAFT_1298270 [Suillus subaureus]|uniref:Uncharacterized protein n=1 Tax=Suillus subaureus TaxID=48587 RepID=A0A9P7JEQ9_9AGAM|nr:uncharacterized protein BJ212DRAFT_1298270 [Suillus subaureus]KAG1818969.1 hypothetical protein BJ212DRAFT_1298270 [Suillus subaureus]
MTQLKKDSAEAKQPSDPIHKKAGRKKSAAEKMALADVQRCKEHSIKTHLQASNTRTNYARHVCHGREWLASHFESSTVSETWMDDIVEGSLVPLLITAKIHADNDVYEDPAFKDAFENILNRCSDKVLALYMSLKGFHENLSKTTVESIHLAFKKMWELSSVFDGDTYHGKWHLNEAKQHWEGNPADSTDIYDVLSSIKHKASAEDIALQMVQKDISLDTTVLDGVLKTYLANETLTLRWQKKVDKGQWEADLRSNHYKIYPHPDALACNSFFWTMVWIKWLESFCYGCTLQSNNFLFPAMSVNGVVHPGQLISYDTVQKWINESTTGAGICGNFSTHCFHQGGAQYWFMFSPAGQ